MTYRLLFVACQVLAIALLIDWFFVMLVLIPASPTQANHATGQILSEHSQVGLRYISSLLFVLQFCLPLTTIIFAWIGEYFREKGE